MAGIAPVPAQDSEQARQASDHFAKWIANGYAGEMEYLKRTAETGEYLRGSLPVAVPWARSVIVCAAPYGSPELPVSTDPAPVGTGWIGRYAWSGRPDAAGELVPSDYHKVLLKRLRSLETTLQTALGAFRSWAYVDTGPVVERAWSAMAGVGWTGKNTCTLNQELGSFFFLAVILTDLEVLPEQQAIVAADRCGSCTRCIDACPTDALIAPRQMDASRCISYLTIEKRGEIDPALRAGMGRQVFGCDICQDVCPWNSRARKLPAGPPLEPALDLTPRLELVNPSLGALGRLTRAEWEKLFFGSPVKRAGFAGFRRNLAVAMGNSGDATLLPQLQAWAIESEPALRQTAVWAAQQLQASLSHAKPAPASGQEHLGNPEKGERYCSA